MPTLVANYIPVGVDVVLQSENGLLGIGPFPYEGDEDPDLINAGKQTVTTIPGSVFFDGAESFAMIRGGHIDLAILGAMQVSQNGDGELMIPGKWSRAWAVPCPQWRKARYCNDDTDEQTGASKLVESCTLPVTAQMRDRVVTNLAVMDVTGMDFLFVNYTRDLGG